MCSQGADWRRGEPRAELALPWGLFKPHLRQPTLTPQRTRSSFIPTLKALQPLTPPWHRKGKRGGVQKEERRQFWGEELPFYY